MAGFYDEIIEESSIVDYRVDQYNIYHIYFLHDDGQRYRFFLSGQDFQRWCFENLDTKVMSLGKFETKDILNKYKENFMFTLDLDSLYPR